MNHSIFFKSVILGLSISSTICSASNAGLFTAAEKAEGGDECIAFAAKGETIKVYDKANGKIIRQLNNYVSYVNVSQSGNWIQIESGWRRFDKNGKRLSDYEELAKGKVIGWVEIGTFKYECI